jgi:hypothetical protein
MAGCSQQKGVEDGNQKRREGSSQPAQKSNPYIEKPFADGCDGLCSKLFLLLIFSTSIFMHNPCQILKIFEHIDNK